MTAELYRGRSKTSRFQFEGEMVSGFNAGNRIGTGKRPSGKLGRQAKVTRAYYVLIGEVNSPQNWATG